MKPVGLTVPIILLALPRAGVGRCRESLLTSDPLSQQSSLELSSLHKDSEESLQSVSGGTM